MAAWQCSCEHRQPPGAHQRFLQVCGSGWCKEIKLCLWQNLHFLKSMLNDIFRKGERERTCTRSHEDTACVAFCIYVQHLYRLIYQLLSAATWNWKEFTRDRNLFWDEDSEQSLQTKSRRGSMPMVLTYMEIPIGLQLVAHTGWAQLCWPLLLLPSVHWMLMSFVMLPKQNLEGFWNTLGIDLKVCSLKESLQNQPRTRNTLKICLWKMSYERQKPTEQSA